MARYISLFNNKGGVGKTTLTQFFADFLSSTKKKGKKEVRVLVIDFDPQASCSNAILGLENVLNLKNDSLTLASVLMQKPKTNRLEWSKYIQTRAKDTQSKNTKVKLGNLDILIADYDSISEFERVVAVGEAKELAIKIKKDLDKKYDFIFIDLPGNLSMNNSFSMLGIMLVEYFIIPVEPNRLSINALPSTIKVLDKIMEQHNNPNKTKLLGFILNRADKRTKQFKLHKDELIQLANLKESKIYENILPSTTSIANSTDDTIHNTSIKDKYSKSYEHIRKLIIEVLPDIGVSTSKTKKTKG